MQLHTIAHNHNIKNRPVTKTGPLKPNSLRSNRLSSSLSVTPATCVPKRSPWTRKKGHKCPKVASYLVHLPTTLMTMNSTNFLTPRSTTTHTGPQIKKAGWDRHRYWLWYLMTSRCSLTILICRNLFEWENLEKNAIIRPNLIIWIDIC